VRLLRGRAQPAEPDGLGRYRAFIVLGGSMNTDQDVDYPLPS
jgi:hypothetical protein